LSAPRHGFEFANFKTAAAFDAFFLVYPVSLFPVARYAVHRAIYNAQFASFACGVENFEPHEPGTFARPAFPVDNMLPVFFGEIFHGGNDRVGRTLT
jgi:hypothetical protein